MTKIINAFSDGSQSIADSLKSLGDSYFGNVANQSVVRETARGKKRENDNIEPFAAAARDGDSNALTYYGAMANKSGRDAAQYNLLSRSNNATGFDDPKLAIAGLGAGESAGNTAIGQRRALDNSTGIARIQSDTQAATQRAIADRQAQQLQWQDQHTLVEMMAPDGRTLRIPKSEVAALQSQGYKVGVSPDTQYTADSTAATSRSNNATTVAEQRRAEEAKPITVYPNGVPTIATHATAPGQPGAPLSTDQVTAGLIQQQVNGQGTGGQQQGMPPGYIHPLVQKALNHPAGATAYQHLQSGAIGQSYDGGAHIDGAPAGPGWVPVTSPDAIGQTRTNQQIQQAAQPLPPPPAAYPQTAVDAANTSGAGRVLQHEYNKVVGFFGGGEVGADKNRAGENLTNLANEARSVMLSAPGRASVQAQHWANLSIPQPGMFGMTGASGAEEQNKVMSFIKSMRDMYAVEAQEVQDRSIAPQSREAIRNHMAQLKRMIDLYERPAAAPAGQQGAPQPQAPQGAQIPANIPPPAQRQPGVYSTPRGPMQWTGTGWVPPQ